MLQIVVQTLKIVTVGAIAVLVVLAGLRFFTYYLDREAAADIGQPVVVQVTEEDNADSVAAKLAGEELIRSELYFTLRMRFVGDDLLPGTYTLRKGMSVPAIIDAITGVGDEEDVTPPTALTVQTIEGWRMEQFAAAVEEAGLEGGAAAFLAASASTSPSQWDFLDGLPSDASLEGYLFPDTYEFGSNARPADLVYLMLLRFDQQFTPEMRQRAAEMNLSIHEVVTLASIVEKEAAVAEERPIIANVYLNRLEAGMRLEADPTVQYVLGNEADWWPTLQPGQPSEVESPYNTYLNSGFPPGPICSPSLASIQAVLFPDDNDYLFFVAVGDGTHVFTADYNEHLANIEVYLNNGDATDNGED